MVICLDQVDQIILDRPHYLHGCELNVVKSSPGNKQILREKLETNLLSDTYECWTEMDLEKEFQRLQIVMKQMNEDFLLQRKELEDHCCEQLKELNDRSHKTSRLQQDLEKGISPRLVFPKKKDIDEI